MIHCRSLDNPPLTNSTLLGVSICTCTCNASFLDYISLALSTYISLYISLSLAISRSLFTQSSILTDHFLIPYMVNRCARACVHACAFFSIPYRDHITGILCANMCVCHRVRVCDRMCGFVIECVGLCLRGIVSVIVGSCINSSYIYVYLLFVQRKYMHMLIILFKWLL